MFKYKKITTESIYSDSVLHRKLSMLTNSGNDFYIYGSYMLESLNQKNSIQKCIIAQEKILDSIVGWASLIKQDKKIILNVFVHVEYRNKGIGKKLISLILKNEDIENIYYAPISLNGFSLMSQFIREDNCLSIINYNNK